MKEVKVIKIVSRADFQRTVDLIGDIDKLIAEQELERKRLLEAAETWALANRAEAFTKGNADSTAKYDYSLVAASRQLRMVSGIRKEEVVAALLADERMSSYVYQAYDSKRLTDDYGGSAEKRASLKPFGLAFTEPKRDKLKVG